MATADRWNPETARKAVRATAGWNSISTVRTPCPTPSSTDCLALNRKAPGSGKKLHRLRGLSLSYPHTGTDRRTDTSPPKRSRIQARRLRVSGSAPGTWQSSPPTARGAYRQAAHALSASSLPTRRREAANRNTASRIADRFKSGTLQRQERNRGEIGGRTPNAKSETFPPPSKTPHDRKRHRPGMESFKSGSSSQEAGAAGCSAPEMRKTGPALL